MIDRLFDRLFMDVPMWQAVCRLVVFGMVGTVIICGGAVYFSELSLDTRFEVVTWIVSLIITGAIFPYRTVDRIARKIATKITGVSPWNS